jgi:hypothetical protein
MGTSFSFANSNATHKNKTMINHAKNIARSTLRQIPRELIKEATFASATGTAPLADPVELERMEKLGSLFSDSASRASFASPSPSPSPSPSKITTTVASPIAASRSSSTGSAYAQQGDPFGGGRRILRKSKRSKSKSKRSKSKRSKSKRSKSKSKRSKKSKKSTRR